MTVKQRNRNEQSRLEPIFYTYVWYKIKNNKHIPFYVGKGKGKRYSAKAHFNNIQFKRTYEKYECYYEIVLNNVTDYEAINKEIELISLYGRKNKNEGTLINYTDGGDGTAGYIFTEEQLLKQKEHLIKNIFNNSEVNKRRIENARISSQKPEVGNKISIKVKERFKNDKDYYDKIANHNREMAKRPEVLERLKNNLKMTDDKKVIISKKIKESWIKERKEQKSKQMQDKYSDPNEREKQSQIVKEAMSKLPKEKLSRRHTCKLSIDTLIEMTNNRHLTQPKMAEKYNTSIATAKSIKGGTHWIYDHMRENNIPIMEIPKDQKFRCSVSIDVLLQIVKDKDLELNELKLKYANVSIKIIGQVKNGTHWIYEYIKLNSINL